ncbi:MAG TPA: tetratricopeptide repeat protein, partial [Burkholderiaceae bacterium]
MTNIEPPQHAGPLKPEQAMQQAVAHHRSGRLQDAERLYHAILQAQPAHPDANHNLGVLAVQTRQVMASLPFFKAALEAMPSNRQYWLSYIDTLIKAGLADDARKILEQARKMGLAGEGVQALAAKLEAPPGEEP